MLERGPGKPRLHDQQQQRGLEVTLEQHEIRFDLAEQRSQPRTPGPSTATELEVPADESVGVGESHLERAHHARAQGREIDDCAEIAQRPFDRRHRDPPVDDDVGDRESVGPVQRQLGRVQRLPGPTAAHDIRERWRLVQDLEHPGAAPSCRCPVDRPGGGQGLLFIAAGEAVEGEHAARSTDPPTLAHSVEDLTVAQPQPPRVGTADQAVLRRSQLPDLLVARTLGHGRQSTRRSSRCQRGSRPAERRTALSAGNVDPDPTRAGGRS